MSGNKFAKHIGEGVKVDIDGDEFVLKPAGIDVTAKHLFTVARKTSENTDSKGKGMSAQSMDDEFADAVAGLITETLKVSYPDEPDSDMKAFAMKYMFMLMEPVMKLYEMKTHESSKYAKIEAMRKKQQANTEQKKDEKVVKH